MPLALAAGRLVGQQLYGVGPADLATMALGAGGMTIVAIAAAMMPAVRAMRIDPAVVLKHEAGS